jgi:hypothetical protein
MERKCGNCRFWLEKPDVIFGVKTYGVCRRNPPRAWTLTNGKVRIWRSFPTVSPVDWCGEHQERTEP